MVGTPALLPADKNATAKADGVIGARAADAEAADVSEHEQQQQYVPTVDENAEGADEARAGEVGAS